MRRRHCNTQHASSIAIADRAQHNSRQRRTSARHALTLLSTIERTSRNEFYSNRRRATFLFEFCVARIFRECFVLVSTYVAVPFRTFVDRSHAVDIIDCLLARISVRFPFACKRRALCLPGKVYSDERVTLVQSCEKAILRLIRHAKSR